MMSEISHVQKPDRTTQKRLERLYIFWLMSFFLLLTLIVFAALAVRGALAQQQGRIAELAGRVQVLEGEAAGTIPTAHSGDSGFSEE